MEYIGDRWFSLNFPSGLVDGSSLRESRTGSHPFHAIGALIEKSSYVKTKTCK